MCGGAAALHPVFRLGEGVSDELDGVLFTPLGGGVAVSLVICDWSSLT